MRQVVLIAAGLLVGIGLTLMTDPRLAEMRGDLTGFLPAWVAGNGVINSQ